MSGSDFLVVEFSRNGEEPEKDLAVDGRVYGASGPEVGVRALLIAIAMLVKRKELHAGDRLLVRTPIKGVDIPADD